MIDPEPVLQPSRRQILEHLRAHETATIEALAVATGLAAVTVRHHLNILRQRDLVAIGTESVGRGRPRHVYRLSALGAQSLVDDRYGALAGRLLDALKSGGRSTVDGFFRDMAEDIVAEHRAALDAQSNRQRLDTVTALLAEEGFVVRWERDGDDVIVLESGCPYTDLGAAHHEVCCMDEHLIGRVTGGDVTREQWRLEGDGGCVYRIRGLDLDGGTDGDGG